MSNKCVQIQSVLYHNDVLALEKAICNVENAVSVYRKHVGELECEFHYGDASKEPIFSKEEINILKSKYPQLKDIKYTFFNENTGTAKGHNRLANNCESDYIMIMNPDVLVTPRFFIEMLMPFKDKKVGLTEARQTPIEHPKEYSVKSLQTSWSTTACVVFPLHVYKKVRGFDEASFFMYCDDVDFSWRIRLAGYNLIYCPRAAVYHAKRLSASGAWQPTNAERYYSAEAALMMAYKWSNDELLNKLLFDFKKSKDKIFNKAAHEFTNRKKAGRLPRQLDKEHKIASFIDGGYSKHRFAI